MHDAERYGIINFVAESWKLSSAGRASALQAEGHRFEPYSFHQMRNASRSADYGRVVQLVRTPACHAGGRGFEPHSGRHNIFAFTKALCFDGFQVYASVAQSVEQGTENPRVGGSIPPLGTT